MRMSRIECPSLRYLPLPVQHSGAAGEHNDVIVTLGLLSKQNVMHTPRSHVSLFQIITDTDLNQIINISSIISDGIFQ